MTNHQWKLDVDADGDSYHNECKLGINKNTGRLQWCPGCNCIRVLIVIPATLLPVLLICILLTHLDFVGTVRQEPSRRFLAISKGIVDNSIKDDSFDSHDSRCVAVKFSMNEVVEAEEKGLLRDVRTSFIPPDLVVIPPGCKQREIDWLSESENPLSEDIVNSDEVQLISYLKRMKRQFADDKVNQTLENKEDQTSSKMNDSSDDDENGSVPWKSAVDLSNTAITHNAQQELDETEKRILITLSDSNNTPPGFSAFWRGEGTPDQIRSAQANVMKQYMDTSVQPCNDFYQYACGNWEKLNPIPKDKAAYDTFEMLRESLDGVLRDLLMEHTYSERYNREEATTMVSQLLEGIENVQSLSDSVNARKNRILMKRDLLDKILTKYKREKRYEIDENDGEMKAKNLFISCMNYDLLEQRGIEPLLNLLKSLGGWPVLDQNWDSSKFDWLNMTAYLRLYNNDIFIVEWVGPDIKNSDEYIIQFDQTSLGLPTRDYFLQETNFQYLEAYKKYLTTIIILLGAESSRATKVANEIILFETELAKITQSPEERTNVSVLYKRMTLGELHEIIPQINWQRYLTIVLDRSVNKTEMIVIFATTYMQQLVTLIANTEPRIVANYLLWRFVRHRVNNLDDRFQEAKQKFYFVLFGREQSPPRWKNCVTQVNSNMGMAVGAMFVRKYFDEFSKQDTLMMTHDLQDSFREILNATDWIDGPTKYLAEMKVNAMSLKIGYPDYILKRNELNEKYKDLYIHPDKYFENTLNVLLHLTRNEHSKLGEVVNKTVWHTAPAVVNAYYSRNKNQIMFPAGILQPPFYHRFFPKSLNYGGIGVVIGHELTHGFDDKGRLFDRDGNLHRWWSDSAINNFHERARCLISQYGNYTVSEVNIPVDGENTQGENIADNGGIKQAFLAYKKWLRRQNNLENEILTGINATNTQLFFLNFAQVWCGAMRPEATRSKLKTAVHSPGKFRVTGTLSNSEDFAREYGCALGTPMNPINKCSVW